MRLAYCFECRTLSKVGDFGGTNPEHDGLLQDWIDRHMHGRTLDEHKGGRIFAYDFSAANIERRAYNPVSGFESEELSAMELAAVQEVRAELLKVNQEVFDFRDEVRMDATTCHIKHGQPSWPGKPCIDYHAGSKLLGRRNA